MNYKLLEPVKYGDKMITEITFRKPVMGDLKSIGLKNLGMDEIGTIFGRIVEGGLTTAFFEMLSWPDGMAIAEIISDFLVSSPKTGKTAPAP